LGCSVREGGVVHTKDDKVSTSAFACFSNSLNDFLMLNVAWKIWEGLDDNGIILRSLQRL
jgi:hypothetical protein